MENKKVKIVTHSSKYHPDDVFGVATLMLVLEKENDIQVIRSRDTAVVGEADYAVDVGGEYDVDRCRFDHHQEGGAGKRSNGIPYASFGLVWKTYGEKLCGSKEVSDVVDVRLVQPIDSNDNGIELVASLAIPPIQPLDVRELNYMIRPTWKEDTNLDDLFLRMTDVAKYIINRAIIVAKDEREAVMLVNEAYRSAEDKRVILLDERYPWEQELMKYSEPLFVVYPKRVDNTWSLKTISNGTKYISRKDLPKEWAGKTGEELEKITGVQGALFCHNRLFLATAKTKEALLKLAQIALNS